MHHKSYRDSFLWAYLFFLELIINIFRCWSLSPLTSQGLLGSQGKWLLLVKTKIFQMCEHALIVATVEVKSCFNIQVCRHLCWEEHMKVSCNLSFCTLYIEKCDSVPAGNKHGTTLSSLWEHLKSYVSVNSSIIQ